MNYDDYSGVLKDKIAFATEGAEFFQLISSKQAFLKVCQL